MKSPFFSQGHFPFIFHLEICNSLLFISIVKGSFSTSFDKMGAFADVSAWFITLTFIITPMLILLKNIVIEYFLFVLNGQIKFSLYFPANLVHLAVQSFLIDFSPLVYGTVFFIFLHYVVVVELHLVLRLLSFFSFQFGLLHQLIFHGFVSVCDHFFFICQNLSPSDPFLFLPLVNKLWAVDVNIRLTTSSICS